MMTKQQEIVEQAKSGLSVSQIAQAASVTKGYVYAALKAAVHPCNKPDHPLKELAPRARNALCAEGLDTRAKVQEAYQRGRLDPTLSDPEGIPNFGIVSYWQVVGWLEQE